MRDIPVHDESRLAPARVAAVHDAVQSLPTLGDVLAWSRAAGAPHHPR